MADFKVNGDPLPRQIKLFNCDFREVGKKIKDHSADLIFTDPPFGQEFLPLWDDLGAFAARSLEAGGFARDLRRAGILGSGDRRPLPAPQLHHGVNGLMSR